MRVIKKISDTVYGLVDIVNMLLLVSVVIIVSLEVFLRYIQNKGFSWTTEVSTLLLINIAFLSMTTGVNEKLHIGLTIVYNRLPPTGQKILDKFSDIITMFFGVCFAYFGLRLTMSTWGSTLPATQWPAGMAYIVCPVAGAIVALESLLSLLGLDPPLDENKATGGDELD